MTLIGFRFRRFRPPIPSLIGLLASTLLAPTLVASSAASAQTTNGLVALYTFHEGSGTTVVDQVGDLDLEISDPSAVRWLPGGGLAFDSPTLVASDGPATALNTALRDSGEFTVALWFDPFGLEQIGPARLVTLSADTGNRNLTVGQGKNGSGPYDRYQIRVRTTTTDINGRPELLTDKKTAKDEIHHLVFTRGLDGIGRLYKNGVELDTQPFGGDLGNWDLGYRLGLGNELTETRPWLGEMHRVAIYDRALAPAEIANDYSVGPGTTPVRVDDGLLALYTFQEGQGSVIRDVSGVGSPLDLDIADPSTVTWLADGGLSLSSGTFISSGVPASKIIDAAMLSDEVSVEVWTKTSNLAQSGPARLVSISESTGRRNITLGQGTVAEGGIFDGRVRTETTSLNGLPSVSTGGGTVTEQLHHVVLTRDTKQIQLWVDDEMKKRRWRNGTLDEWDPTYPLLLGNELTADRPWQGELYLVAIYDRELSSADVTRNYWAGPPNGNAPPPSSEELPRLEIQPRKNVLLEVGESHDFDAVWTGAPLPKAEGGNLVWTSSDPDIVSVDANGVATAHVDDAYAVVTVHSDGGFAHRPGYASAAVGAQLRTDFDELPAAYLQDIAPLPSSAAGPRARFRVVANTATRAVAVGDTVVFPDNGGLRIESISDLGSALLFDGWVTGLEDIYYELNVHLDSDSLQTLRSVSEVAAGSASPAALTTRGEGGGKARAGDKAASFTCDGKVLFDPNLDLGMNLEVEITQGRAGVLAMLIDGAAGLTFNQIRAGGEATCEIEVEIPFAFFPFYGIMIRLEEAFLIGADLTGQIGQAASFDTPYALLQQTFSGGLEYRLGQFDLPAALGEVARAFRPGGAAYGSFPDLRLQQEVAGKFEVAGIRAVVGAGIGPYFMADMVELDFGATEVRGGMRSTMGGPTPFVSSPSWVNPEIEGFFDVGATVVKARTGDELSMFLEVMGLGEAELSLGAFEIESKVFPWPTISSLHASDEVLYIDGAPDLPTQTLIQATVSNWAVPVFPNPATNYTFWRRTGSSGDYEILATTTEPSLLWAPTPQDVGTQEFRVSVHYDNPFYLPLIQPTWVSEPIAIHVVPAGPLALDPMEVNLSAPVGETDLRPVTITNQSNEQQVYYFELPAGTPSEIDIDHYGPVTLNPGESFVHHLFLDCSQGLEPGTTRMIASTAEVTMSGSVRYECTALSVDPEQLSFSMNVGESETQSVTVTNLMAQSIVWEVFNTGGLGISPLTGTLPQDGSTNVSISAACPSPGTKNTSVVIGTIIDFENLWIFETLPVSITCKDPGANSWGDPHLVTFDGLKYDFHGKGEFVLARDPGGDFEVQVRQEGSGRIAYNKAVAMRVGSNRVAFYMQPPIGNGSIMVDGSASTIEDGETLSLSGGGTIQREGNVHTVRWPGESSYVSVTRWRGHFNVFTHADPMYAGALVGLMGNFDGDRSNDFALRDGTQLAPPPPPAPPSSVLSFEQLYDCSVGRCFAYDDPDGWLIRSSSGGGAAESLFDYAPGEGPESFAPAPGVMDPDGEVDLADYDPDRVEWAQAQCLAAGIADLDLLRACILDIVISGDVEMGLEAGNIHHVGEAIVEICDGEDNDLDGSIDEEGVCACEASTVDGQSYSVCRTRVPWTAARNACLARGQDLAKSMGPEKNDRISVLVRPTSSVWIGLTDRGFEGSWLWMDGDPLGWDAWGTHEPNGAPGHDEDCVELYSSDGGWNDTNCTWDVAFVCEG